ncbi:outer membrane beta-barrel protein [Maribellus sp. YY47]|uniref:outer membrane beta-barrel protein n=1 Tax=Maribellus sp. YY47 TaxID=2929486 RepID=UPI00200077D2|nr:outer membrane beta-barrel protein [Maribellus sp. YY47]MCK3685467.1 PorT family protein [Maribellus sp. YY47]
MQSQTKILFTVVFCFIAFVAGSQNLVVSAGGNYSAIQYKRASDGSFLNENYTGPGGHIGAFVESTFFKKRQKELIASIGLLGDYKMLTQSLSYSGVENKMNLIYVNVPAYVFYRYRLRSRAKLYAGAGPYVSYGVRGTVEISGAGDIAAGKYKIEWGNKENEDYMKPLDYGVTAKAGYRAYRGFDVAVSYDYGIPNVFVLYDKQSMKLRTLRLTLGYTLPLVD